MFQAQNLFALKQQKLTCEISIGMQVVLLVKKIDHGTLSDTYS
jgi:hypothetical protein